MIRLTTSWIEKRVMRRTGGRGSDDAPIFSHAVVAAAFSPRLTAVLNEAFRILSMMGAEGIIVHVGEKSAATDARLQQAVAESYFSERRPLGVIRQGNPADVLLSIAAEHQADLIIAGALAREGLFKYYLGSVARTLARQADCSVLLLTEPQVKPQPFTRIHCAVEYRPGAEKAVRVAARLAHAMHSRHLFYSHSFTSADFAKNGATDAAQIRRLYQQEDEKLADFIKSLDLADVPYQMRCLHDPDRSMTMSFTHDLEADLLVIHGPTDRASLWDRLFSHDLEAALQHLPCSLLLTR
jgi:nucleotide-binding universal stress UspA family protein